ncbi:MAG: bifunctional oligoribonuclease/PAP phosphatase NrnA [Verrucomicrobiae bacterium]|nr:bifunctional oligoribonuclease/PAP phosphatase NrnA [Verrucomicrobiae bacterium]
MKPYPKVIGRIIEAIKAYDSFCVIGHIRPDGDCVGCQLALAYALKNNEKKVAVWNDDEIPYKYKFLDVEHLIKRPREGYEFDCVITVDSANLSRLGNGVNCIGRRKLFINIDHHESNDRYGDINYVNGKASSTAELVYRILKAARWQITKPIADALFTGISTDTGSFQYSTTKPLTYHIAGELVSKGADIARICDRVYQSFPLSRVKLLKHVYSSFKLTCDDKVAYFWLRKEDFEKAGANCSDTEGLIDHIRSIEPVVVACVFEEEEPGLIRISLRSKSSLVNVNQIAKLFGGGGHAAAAGAKVRGTHLSVQRRVLSAIKNALNSH